MNDLIFDFETLGQDVFKIPALDCSYLLFDWSRFVSNNPYSFQELVDNAKRSKLGLAEQITKYKCKYVQRDIDWWMSQGASAKKVLTPSKDDVTLEEFIEDFLASFRGTKLRRWWSRSNTFDPILISRYAELVGRRAELESALEFWRVRDTRTFIDAKLDFPKINGFVPVKDEAW